MSATEALPRELDFAADPDATSARMNRAMAYLLGLVRAATAQRAEYEVAVEQLRSVGFERLAIALTPLFVEADAQAGEIAAVHAQWVASGALDAIKADLVAMTDARLDALEGTAAASVTAPMLDAAIAAAAARAGAERWFHSHG